MRRDPNGRGAAARERSTAHGSATFSCASWSGRTVGAPAGGGRPAIGAKKPLTTAVRSPAVGHGPRSRRRPSLRRTGSAARTPRSTSGLPSRPSSSRRASPPSSVMQMLSLRVSRWTNASPLTSQRSVAASELRDEPASSHAPRAEPEARGTAPGPPRPRARCGARRIVERAAARRAAPSQWSVVERLTDERRRRPSRHGGGQCASVRSSRTRIGRSPSSSHPRSRGMNGASTSEYTRCSSRRKPAVGSSTATFANARVPSSSSTSHAPSACSRRRRSGAAAARRAAPSALRGHPPCEDAS